MSTTLGWIGELIRLVGESGVSDEQLRRIVERGYFSDLLSGNLEEIDRSDFQRILGIEPTEAIVDEDPVDTFIRVDRSIRPDYPDWVRELLYPGLENVGPSGYDIARVEQWLHPGQFSGVVSGHTIHNDLKEEDDLRNHLGLADLLAIQTKGIGFFREYFIGKAVFGWKSVVRNRDNGLFVPYLHKVASEVPVCWYWLGFGWDFNNPALRFKSI